jgi:hypothetical protein
MGKEKEKYQEKQVGWNEAAVMNELGRVVERLDELGLVVGVMDDDGEIERDIFRGMTGNLVRKYVRFDDLSYPKERIKIDNILLALITYLHQGKPENRLCVFDENYYKLLMREMWTLTGFLRQEQASKLVAIWERSDDYVYDYRETMNERLKFGGKLLKPGFVSIAPKYGLREMALDEVRSRFGVDEDDTVDLSCVLGRVSRADYQIGVGLKYDRLNKVYESLWEKGDVDPFNMIGDYPMSGEREVPFKQTVDVDGSRVEIWLGFKESLDDIRNLSEHLIANPGLAGDWDKEIFEIWGEWDLVWYRTDVWKWRERKK